MWRVMVVEDDPEMRAFFAASVERCPDLQLSASVGTVQEATAWLDAHGADIEVMLVDLGLPDGSGLEVIRHAARAHLACESLVISMFGDEDNVLASIEAGALGYIHKDASTEDIAQTILDMRHGASPISPMIARRVLAKYQADSRERAREKVSATQAAAVLPKLLTPREHEVLDLISRGFSYTEVARLQGLSMHTVQSHIKNLYAKLAVHSKSEAVFEGTRMGLLRVSK
mgnify:CR=1 FL=1